MKPKNLTYPFPWEERTVVIHDRVWFIPENYDNYDSFVFPGWSAPEVFGNNNPVAIEYCSGNGTWIAEKAKENPHINWVAVEKRFMRVRKIWSKIKNLRLNNLLIISGEGHLATSHYLPADSVDQVYVNFPDPWPKKRHAKNRIIKGDFVKELRRILKEKGELTMVTDDPDYSEEMIQIVGGEDGFYSKYPAPYYVTEMAGYGTSFFDELWREKGRTIRYHQHVAGAVQS